LFAETSIDPRESDEAFCYMLHHLLQATEQ
jgi:hypothetical protein